MSKFDTHGGYFAPKDYMRINEGGSHEENPNGGVQVGVDEQGVPNMLEEGEPVYKDYVYSDNIKASKRFLEANNIPPKYEGMLYSEIADSIFEEAEERPNDPISRNGLEAMLGRLADSQEQQKQDSERRKLERELSKLSPEELDALQQELVAAEEQAQPQEMAPEQPVAPEEQMPIAQPVEQIPMEQQAPVEQPMPIMANGGLLKKYDDGGYYGGGHSGQRIQVGEPNLMTPGFIEWIVPGAKAAKGFKSAAEIGKHLISKYGHDASSLIGKVRDLESAKAAAEKVLKEVSSMKQPYKSVGTARQELRIITKELDKFKKGAKEAEELINSLNASQAAASAPEIVEAVERGKKAAAVTDDVRKSMKGIGTVLKTTGKAIVEPGSLLNTVWNPKGGLGKIAKGATRIVGDGAYYTYGIPKLVGGIGNAIDIKKDVPVTSDFSDMANVDLVGPTLNVNAKACGGTINKFDGKTGLTGQMSRGRFASDVEDLRDAIYAQPTNVLLPFNIGSTLSDARNGFLSGISTDGSVGSNPYETGPIYSGTDFDEFLKWLSAYNGSRDPGRADNTYAPDSKFNYGTYGNIKALEASEPYRNFTESIIDAINGDDPDAREMALEYLRAYESNIAGKAQGKIFKNRDAGELADNWVDQYRKVRTYQPGIGHLSGNFNDLLLNYKAKKAIDRDNANVENRAKDTAAVDLSAYNVMPNPDLEMVEESLPDSAPKPPVVGSGNGAGSNTDYAGVGPFYPTFPRYAGAIGAGLLAAYDAFTPPDRYTATRINPYVPVGHINLQNQRYMSVDQNMIQNQMLAQGNSTQRALRNSGLGPSAGAAILAADNNTTGNLGTGFLQSWQANNQQRNAVIAANNQAEAQRAHFDYAVDVARQRALNEAQIRNAQNDLMLQRLNYGAEGEKYAALSNQLNAGFNALAGIGRENFFRNQANSNTALEGYRTLAGGYGRYLPDYDFWNTAACGGHIKKSKK